MEYHEERFIGNPVRFSKQYNLVEICRHPNKILDMCSNYAFWGHPRGKRDPVNPFIVMKNADICLGMIKNNIESLISTNECLFINEEGILLVLNEDCTTLLKTYDFIKSKFYNEFFDKFSKLVIGVDTHFRNVNTSNKLIDYKLSFA